MKLLAVVAAALLAVGFVPGSVRAQDTTPVRIGITPIDPASTGFYAADLGLYAKDGLNASVQMMGNSGAVLEALVGGSLDIGYVGITTGETAFKKGLPIVMIAPTGIFDIKQGRVGYIMLRNDIPFKTAKDLEGKTIASIPLRNVGELAMDLWIDTNGGDSSKVKYVEVPFPATGPALQQGRIDGAILIEPFASQDKPFARAVGPDPMASVASFWLGGTFVTTKAWAAAHPDQVRRFAAAVAEAGQWANKNPDKSALILQKYSNVPLEMIKASSRTIFTDQLKPAMIQPTIDLLVRYKQIDASFKAEDMIYQPPK
jgi:NitT/TauT family transport system substrate-binding protein